MKKLIMAIMATATLCGCGNATQNENALPKVYMTTDISPEGLVKVYEALGVEATGNVAVIPWFPLPELLMTGIMAPAIRASQAAEV